MLSVHMVGVGLTPSLQGPKSQRVMCKPVSTWHSLRLIGLIDFLLAYDQFGPIGNSFKPLGDTAEEERPPFPLT